MGDLNRILQFRPYFVQRGRGPHINELIFATDENGDTFPSDIALARDGITITGVPEGKKFGINVRWHVEDFGAGYITADNGGNFYEMGNSGAAGILNLNYELAGSRVERNKNRLKKFETEGYIPSREVRTYLDLSNDLLDDATRTLRDDNKCAVYSQKALFYALWGSEMLEIEKARADCRKIGWRERFFFGCDARHYHQMPKSVFMDRFTDLFNFAHITYVVNGDDHMQYFEPVEGQLRFEHRDLLFKDLREANITVGGRTLFWFHTWVTPEWLKKKSYDELKIYVEKHTRDVIKHYGSEMYAWEIVNEFHDWANEIGATPEQAVELTGLACDVARAEAPGVHRLINNCCPFAEYVHMRQWSGQPAKYRQRTPFQFTRDLIDAGVDFTRIGQQVYFPYRDLQDTILMIERYESLGIPVQLSEIGCPGGATRETMLKEDVVPPERPYIWHRPWDDELQADWLESVYLSAYSKLWIEAANWFDLIDPFSYQKNGGILRSPNGEKKPAFDRLKKIQQTLKET